MSTESARPTLPQESGQRSPRPTDIRVRQLARDAVSVAGISLVGSVVVVVAVWAVSTWLS